jgi:hypothetical protein
LLRLSLITIVTLGGTHLVFTELAAVQADIGRWAGQHDLDGDFAFASALLVAAVVALGITILVRRGMNLGLRSADRLFLEFFWALFTLAVALLPPALRASLGTNDAGRGSSAATRRPDTPVACTAAD